MSGMKFLDGKNSTIAWNAVRLDGDISLLKFPLSGTQHKEMAKSLLQENLYNLAQSIEC